MKAKELFEILVRENSRMLIAYIRSAVRDDSAADDIWQETMLVAWRRIDAYDRTRPFGPWLRGIANNTILAHYRKSQREVAVDDSESLEYLSWRFEQVHQLAGDTFDEKLGALRDCVNRLPENYRQAIKLRYLENRKPTQLSQQLNVALETVKKRLQRAKTQLLECVNRKIAVVNKRTVS